MIWIVPAITDFKNQFTRDFPYAPTGDLSNPEYVMDADITRAISDAEMDFNEGLFGTNATKIFLYLVAYHLVQNVQSSMKGISALAQFVNQNTTVGSVSIGNMVVGQFADNPILAKYLKNAYGQKYIELAHPYLIGNIGVAQGMSTNA